MEANLASRRDERYFDAVFGGPLPPAACSFNCCPGIARFVHAPITTIILDGAPRSRRLCSLASLLALSASGGFSASRLHSGAYVYFIGNFSENFSGFFDLFLLFYKAIQIKDLCATRHDFGSKIREKWRRQARWRCFRRRIHGLRRVKPAHQGPHARHNQA